MSIHYPSVKLQSSKRQGKKIWKNVQEAPEAPHHSLRKHKRPAPLLISFPATLTISPAPATPLSTVSSPLLSDIFLTLPSPTFLPSGSKAQGISPGFRIVLCTRPRRSMPTYGSLSIWTVGIEKGTVRSKWLGTGTCFRMSSNSRVLVMLEEAGSVLGVGRVSCAQPCFAEAERRGWPACSSLQVLRRDRIGRSRLERVEMSLCLRC